MRLLVTRSIVLVLEQHGVLVAGQRGWNFRSMLSDSVTTVVHFLDSGFLRRVALTIRLTRDCRARIHDTPLRV